MEYRLKHEISFSQIVKLSCITCISVNFPTACEQKQQWDAVKDKLRTYFSWQASYMVISSPFIKINEGFRYELNYRCTMDDHSPDVSVTYKFLMEIQLLWEILWWTCYEKKDFVRQDRFLQTTLLVEEGRCM